MTDAPATVPAAWRVRVNMVIGWPLFHALYGLSVVGRDRVPRTGPVVFVGNHVGTLHSLLVIPIAMVPAALLVSSVSRPRPAT